MTKRLLSLSVLIYFIMKSWSNQEDNPEVNNFRTSMFIQIKTLLEKHYKNIWFKLQIPLIYTQVGSNLQQESLNANLLKGYIYFKVPF